MICLTLLFVISLIFISCDSAITNPDADQTTKLSKKPAPNLMGEMDLTFDLAATVPDDPVWVGTVEFEGMTEIYGLRFFHLSPFKGYSQASPFEEIFEVFDQGTEQVLMRGPDVGVTTLANKPPDDVKYRMNGIVEEAYGVFEPWLGRHVHMSGIITWQIITTPDGPVVAPATAPGIMRVN